MPNGKSRSSRTIEAVRSIKAKYMARRTFIEKLADRMTEYFGSVNFLFFNALFFVTWIYLNGRFLAIKPFDPYPFTFLTMVVSLEAIFLSIFVLISQNRSTKIEELRDELDLKVDTISESELTELLKMNIKLLNKNHINIKKDKNLREMLKPIDEAKIERSLEKQIDKS